MKEFKEQGIKPNDAMKAVNYLWNLQKKDDDAISIASTDSSKSNKFPNK